MYGGGALEKGAVGILVEEQLASSCNARDFPRLHPREARAALAAAVGTASVRQAAKHGDQYAGLPDLLRHFMGLGRSLGRDCRDFRSSFRSQDFAHRDLSMGTTSGGFLQGVRPGFGRGFLPHRFSVSDWVVPGLAEVVDIAGDSVLAWNFLSQEWPYADRLAKPIDLLTAGQILEALDVDVAPALGSTLTQAGS